MQFRTNLRTTDALEIKQCVFVYFSINLSTKFSTGFYRQIYLKLKCDCMLARTSAVLKFWHRNIFNDILSLQFVPNIFLVPISLPHISKIEDFRHHFAFFFIRAIAKGPLKKCPVSTTFSEHVC